jgi:hypothetical protein
MKFTTGLFLGDEDCLYLHVYVPEGATNVSALPVVSELGCLCTTNGKLTPGLPAADVLDLWWRVYTGGWL